MRYYKSLDVEAPTTIADSSQYDFVVEGHLNPNDMDVTFFYRKATVSPEIAEEVCAVLVCAAKYLTMRPEDYSVSVSNGVAFDPLSHSFFGFMAGTDRSTAWSFWNKKLAGSLKLPATIETPSRQPSHAKRTMSLKVPARMSNDRPRIEATILSALGLVRSKLAESDGTTIGMRSSARWADLPGLEHLSNAKYPLKPMRLYVDWNSTIGQFLQETQHTLEQTTNFEGLGLHWLRQVSLESATACDFDAVLVFQDQDGLSAPWSNAGAIVQRATITEASLSSDFQVLEMSMISSTETETRMLRTLSQVESAIRILLCEESALKTLQDAVNICDEQLETLWKWNAAVASPTKASIIDLISTTMRGYPDKLAIHAWNGSLTYQQLDDLSTNLAYRLLQLGVGQGDIIPLCFEKSMWMPVAMLGVMKTGAASVGVDPKQPVGRLSAVVEEVKARLIISSKMHSSLASRIGSCTVFVVGDTGLDHSGAQGKLPLLTPTGLLYAVFTSGSTGKPKGVLISHQSYASAVTSQHEPFGFSKDSRTLDFSSYAFDAAWFNLLHTLTIGGCLCVPSEGELQNELSLCFERYKVNIAFMTPSMARYLREASLSHLEHLLIGGEIVLPEDIEITNSKDAVKIVYGPSECTPMITSYKPTDSKISIGKGRGACTWVVDMTDSTKLAPIGVVGELWLEGPLVGEGYLNDAERTATSFIQDPPWLINGAVGGSNPHHGRSGRLYRTGDLVSYDDEGNLMYVRRKDTQVKIRGQRVELSEVEHHISTQLRNHLSPETGVQVAAEIIRPKDLDTTMLLAFVSITGDHSSLDYDEKVVSATAAISKHLAELIPTYMVPAAYIPIRGIPTTITGKTDRRALRDIGTASWLHSRDVEDSCLTSTPEPSNEIEKLLQNVWKEVLNLPLEAVSMDKPFTRLGGDSITAMQVSSKCRAQNISVAVSDILKAGTISKLATCCKRLEILGAQAQGEANTCDNDCTEFGLAPIQEKFFQMFPDGLDQFNQSFFMSLKHNHPTQVLLRALAAVVSKHGLLRARYAPDTSGCWRQRIAEDSSESFAFSEHSISVAKDASKIAQKRQEQLRIRDGPVFACDLFRVGATRSMVLLSAHHLVVDLMSWRVIWADIEEHMKTGRLSTAASPSFRRWAEIQGQIAALSSSESVLPFDIPEAEMRFWGLSAGGNTYGDSINVVKTLDLDTSTMILGESNQCLRTEPLDILLGAYAYSFHQLFPDRKSPAIYLEGHGREQLPSSALDLSSIVGWFTTILPLPLNIQPQDTIIEAVRLAKDTRARVLGKGQPYFASRYHNQHCATKFRRHDEIELLFNFAGRYQQLESDDSLLSLVRNAADSNPLRTVHGSARRIALIEANIAIEDGKVITTFTVNKGSNHLNRLHAWFDCFILSLQTAVRSLKDRPQLLTLSDIPGISLSYRGLDSFLAKQLPSLGISADNIANVYPVTPLQEGILLSSSRGTSGYATFWIWTCTTTDPDGAVSVWRLRDAWRAVIQRHQILSTVFCPHPESSGYIQVALKDCPDRISYMESISGSPSGILRQIDRPRFEVNQPEHALAICKSGTQVALRLDINHTLIDGSSLVPLVQDLIALYEGQALPPTPCFGEVATSISHVPKRETLDFWTRFLEDAQPCAINRTASLPPTDTRDTFQYLTIFEDVTAGILPFCKAMAITRSVFLQVAWALVLSQLSGMQDVCFGYLASGRSAQVDGIENLVGPLANMLISRIDLSMIPSEAFKKVAQDSIHHLDHQHMSLATIHHAIGIKKGRLFSTAMTVREADNFNTSPTRMISMQYCDHQDPHEVVFHNHFS